jgi:hypothetical protein
MMWRARASCRGPNITGGRSMVRHLGGPTTNPTIKLAPPLKISLILVSSADSGPSAPTVASQQCGASEDARGWSASNRKQTYQVGFGWWSDHPPYHTKIHPTQPPHNHLQASRCRPFWTKPRHPLYAYGVLRPPMWGGGHMMTTRGRSGVGSAGGRRRPKSYKSPHPPKACRRSPRQPFQTKPQRTSRGEGVPCLPVPGGWLPMTGWG